MKNLLLISNISSQNEALIKYAAKFCKHYGSKLHVLHIADTSSAVLVSSPKYYKAFDIEYKVDKPRKAIQEIYKATDGILDREFFDVKIIAGNQSRILDNFINENFIDFIILGNSDLDVESDLKEHKNLLLNLINTPLMIVPEFHTFQPISKFNFLTTKTQNDLNHIVKLIGYFPKSKIRLTHLVTAEDHEIQNQKSDKWLEYVKDKAGKIIQYESIIEDLNSYVKQENYSVIKRHDAIVFTTNKRNFWTRLFDPSTTLGFLTSLEIPAVIFKIKE